MAGAPKGNQNRKGKIAKIHYDINARLAELDCDPFEGMVRVARRAEKNGELTIAGTMYKELAKYVLPQKKAIEHTGEVDINTTITAIKRVIVHESVKAIETQALENKLNYDDLRLNLNDPSRSAIVLENN